MSLPFDPESAGAASRAARPEPRGRPRAQARAAGSRSEEGVADGGRPGPSYSPDRRTGVLLCGAGAHGAYHAGVLRALHEAGVRIDLMGGIGVGAASAAVAALDGAARLWDAGGPWRPAVARTFYRWTRSARAAVWLVALLLGAVPAWSVGVLLGVPAPAWPLAALVVLLSGAAVAVLGRSPGGRRRRTRGMFWWRVLGAPVDARQAREVFAGLIWDLLRGAAPAPQPSPGALAGRYAEALAENLGQPGFRELILVATDLDARRDVTAAMLRDPFREDFFTRRRRPGEGTAALDLAGVGREHSLDLVAAALTPPLVCAPHPVTFAPDSFWRGETHRLCYRPASIHRLLEEAALAGVTQVIVVSAVAPADAPHRLRSAPIDPRRRLGEALEAEESAALRDALEMARLRFDGVYLIGPVHNPVGPFDCSGAYDEASDRRQGLQELMERAYADAYYQFVDPIVGASGEQLARTSSVT